MAPPRTSASPLLHELDPTAVAGEVCERILRHLGRLAFVITPTAECVPVARQADGSSRAATAEDLATGSDIGLTVQALTEYAQKGAPVWDWEDAGMASDGCLSVMSALYTCAGSSGVGGGIADLEDSVEADDEVGVVILAALARIRIDQRKPVALRELAVLSGLSLRQVQHLAKQGEIAAIADGRVSASHARAWLSARAVPGFRTGKETR